MQIVINVPEKEFGVDIEDKFQDFFKRLEAETREHLMTNTELVCGNYELETIEMFLDAFKEMRIIPSNATNGDMIKAMFPNGKEYDTIDGDIRYEIEIDLDYSYCSYFDGVWWNAPYKKEV